MPNAADTKKLPYLANYPPLADWLRKHGARCQWQATTDGRPASAMNSMVEAWLLGDSMCVIVVHPDCLGWDIFTPGGNPNIGKTLADAEKRLGLS